MSLCEIRIPTYKRPEMLQRALQSVIDQDYSDWIALVMDDSPDREAQLVVEKFNDARIQYLPNESNLGCSGNINQAFNPTSLRGGEYACILEDDNWLMPHFLSENIRSLHRHGVDLILRNQEIWLQTSNTSTPTDRTTRGMWFTNKIYTPFELKAHLFYFEGISNGGMFWKTTIKSNFQVSKNVLDAGLQEYCRTLQIEDDLYFESQPLCYWSEMSSTLSLRNAVDNRIFGRGIQAIKRHLLAKYGDSIVTEAAQIGTRWNQQLAFEISLLDSLCTKYNFQYLTRSQCFYQYLKSYAKFKLIQDPLRLYFMSNQ